MGSKISSLLLGGGNMDYILTFSNGFGKVSSGEYLFDINSVPILPFAFDALYYETPTQLAFKVVNGVQIALTDEEIAACCAYCDGYLKNGDYPVQSYEAESGLYRGVMLKSEAEEKGYYHILDDIPEHPVSKRVGNSWERIAAIIRSDGSYVLMPASVCDACVIFMTAAEWEAHSKPVRNTERWDFATETWKDDRTVEEAKKSADEWIRQAFVMKRQEIMGSAPYQELASWSWQLSEAQAWKVDNGTSTPFLDAVLAALNAEAVTVSKTELVDSVLKYSSSEWMQAIGKVHGEMYVQIHKLREMNTLSEIDQLTDTVAGELNTDSPTFALNFKTVDGIPAAERLK